MKYLSPKYVLRKRGSGEYLHARIFGVTKHLYDARLFANWRKADKMAEKLGFEVERIQQRGAKKNPVSRESARARWQKIMSRAEALEKDLRKALVRQYGKSAEWMSLTGNLSDKPYVKAARDKYYKAANLAFKYGFRHMGKPEKRK